MIEVGTKIIVNGVPYKVSNCIAGTIGCYVLVVQYMNEANTDIRESMELLMREIDKFSEPFDKMKISALIVSWFIDEKIKSGINAGEMIRLKSSPNTAESQIRRLIKFGAGIEEIIEVLAFAITDKFWSGVLSTSINSIAKEREDGLTLYSKIKNQMVNTRHSTISENYQRTAEDDAGIIITE
jgi:hypothetical protein